MRKLWARMERLRVGDPLDKNTDVGAINSRRAARAHRGAGRRGRARGRDAALDRLRAARDRLLVPADDVPRRRAGEPDRGRGDLRPGRVGHDVPHARPRPSSARTTRPTAWPPACGPTTAPRRSRSRAQLRAGVVWQNTYNQFDPTAAFGGYKESGFGREGGPAGLLPYVRLGDEPPRAGRQDLQALPGRRVRALGVRPQRPDDRRAGEHVANVPRGSRKDVRDAVKAARGAPAAGRSATAYNRGQVLYRFAEALESRSDELARAAVAQQGTRWPPRAPRSARPSTCSSTTRAGRTSSPAVMGGINPVAAPYLSFSTPEPTGVVAVLAPDEPDLLGLVREVAPGAGRGQHGRRGRLAPLAAARAGPRRGRRRLRRPGRRAEPAVRPASTSCSTPLCGHRDVNAIVDATGDAERAATIDELAAETVKRVSAARRRRRPTRSRAWRR